MSFKKREKLYRHFLLSNSKSLFFSGKGIGRWNWELCLKTPLINQGPQYDAQKYPSVFALKL